MNNTSCFPSADEPPDVTDLRNVTYAIIMPVILALGFLFNTFSLCVAGQSALNSVALSYLIALISSNLSLMILAVPWLIHRSSEPSECYSHSDAFYHAYIEPVLLNWMATFSTYILLCMSIERFLSVTHPALFRRIHLLPRARAALLVFLCLSFAIHVPMYLKQIVICPECWTLTINIDTITSSSWTAYICVSQIMARFIPCAALIILNISTIFKYRRIINKRSRMTSEAVSMSQINTPNCSLTNLSSVFKKKTLPSSSSQEEKRQLKILSGLVCLVAVCIVPAGVAALLPYDADDGGYYRYYTLGVVVEALELFHHSVVSFVICLCNNDIHRRVRKMITCNSSSLTSI
ncbi:probable G-protein coupled receptor AH9.1 [Daphnia pulex]|uniref:probable G-protein coupled receptor AH9.1 n=1 Tax=Daphnia pulex TaxID=6669 RepID=UPI001EE05CEA|nr:probable G-protein coupled receptor AH9.1 [Daphnia pulex]